MIKSFVKFIAEDWFDASPKTGDIYKNPTAKDMREFAKELMRMDDMTGIVVGDDVYLATRGFHDDLIAVLKTRGVSGNIFKFRGEISRSGKIKNIGPTGGNVPTKDEKDRFRLFRDILRVYKHKRLSKFMSTPEEVFLTVKTYFGYERAMDEFNKLMKQHFD